jgi:hypothetical protein
MDCVQTPQVSMHRVVELRPHPCYVRHQLKVPASKLSALTKGGDLAFSEPIVITQDRIILDGYARYELARLRARPTLLCIEYQLNDLEALHFLLQRHLRSDGLNDFGRVLLALDLEPWLEEKARENQRIGGRAKGLSNLTEADRVDVRQEIADAAGVCAANVRKVQQLRKTALPEILDALRAGEIRIHRGWKLSRLTTADQLKSLQLYRSKKGVGKAIRQMIARHKTKHPPNVFDLGTLLHRLSELDLDEAGSITVSGVKVQGKGVYLSEELMQTLAAQEELDFSWQMTQ